MEVDGWKMFFLFHGGPFSKVTLGVTWVMQLDLVSDPLEVRWPHLQARDSLGHS